MLTGERTRGKRVQFMATCLCDAFYGEAARATVEVLEWAGCTVEFPEGQTCCGQPAFNGGDWKSARKVARHTLEVFGGAQPVVVPSGSCAAMVFHGYGLAFAGEPEGARAGVAQMAGRTWELCDFLVNGLGVEAVPGEYAARIAVHHSCHTRGTATGAAMEKLLRSIRGVELVSFTEPDQCCGFGGTFAVAFPHVSQAMGQLKVEQVLAARPDLVVSADLSCLMHQHGLAEKQGLKYPIRHVAEVLAAALGRGAGQ